jgi:enoyl-CoA hydratase/carnithine racemase
MTIASRLLTVETMDELTVARFHWPGIRAVAELSIGTELDDFFEGERTRPSKVVVFIAPPDLVDAANLELRDAFEADLTSHELVQRMLRRENVVRRLVTAVRDAEAFTVAVVHGAVALRMASPLLACDYRIVSETTTFHYAARETPVAPAGGVLWFLNRLVGPATTVEMVLGGAPLSAADAVRLGLVSFVAPAAEFETAALAEARRIAALPSQVLHQLKRSMVASCERLDTYFDREAALLVREASTLLRHADGG